MTQQQRRATRNALARYGQRGYRQTFEGRGWSLAIEQALSYYDQTDPIRARLLGCATLSIGASRMSWSSST